MSQLAIRGIDAENRLVDEQMTERTAQRVNWQREVEARILQTAVAGTVGIDQILQLADETNSSRSDIDYSISRLQQIGKLTFDGHGYRLADAAHTIDPGSAARG